MRHELAELQRQLTEAQQRIASELQGRAEDADRIEDLESRIQGFEAKARDDEQRIAELNAENVDTKQRLEVSTKSADELRRDLEARDARAEELQRKHRELSDQLEGQFAALREAKAQLEARNSELAARAGDRDAKTRLEKELEELAAKHRQATEQLEAHASSLLETKALLVDREAELATKNSERTAQQELNARLETELQDVKRTLEAGRARATDLAKQLATMGQGLADVVLIEEVRRPRPPTLPPSKVPPPIPADAKKVEPDRVFAVEPVQVAQPRSRWGVALGGIAVGAAVSLVSVHLGGASAPPPPRAEPSSAPPSAAMTAAPAPISYANPVADPATAPIADAGTAPDDASAHSGSGSLTVPPAPVDAQSTGVLVLPPEADGRRVYVDGRRLEPKDRRLVVACGKREVQIGSRGEARTIDVACAGETEVR